MPTNKKTAPKKSVKTTNKSYRKPAPAAKKKKSAKKARRSAWALPVVFIMLIALAGIGIYVYGEAGRYIEFRDMRASVERSTFYDGVVIDGVDVGGRKYDEVLAYFQEKDDSYAQALSFSFTFNGLRWSLSAADLGYSTNTRSIIDSAHRIGRYGTLEERYAQVNRVQTEGMSYSITRNYDAALLKDKVEEIAAELSYPAGNASVKSFDVSSRTFTFSDSTPGAKVEPRDLYNSATSVIESGIGGQEIAVVQTAIAPTKSKSELAANYGRITSATTSASGSTKNRLTNIELALSSFNGYRLGPGESFSFNGTVGQRTTAKGYKSAGAFSDGLLTQEVGGGICQTSTTLFNAAVKANLTIVERSPHSRPVTYVDKGKDAAVSWPGPDLVFKNPTDEPVYLVAYLTKDNNVVVEVYGRLLENGMSIKVEATTTDTLKPGADTVTVNHSLAPGSTKVIEKARNGYKAVAYKIYLDKNGNEIKREELCRSTYRSSGAIIEVGPS